LLVPVSVSDPSINPYSNEFYNKGCIIINKLRLKKHHTQEQGWMIFIKKENTGRYGNQSFKPSIFKLSLWESKEFVKGLEDLSKEIQKAALENITNEIPRLKHHNSRCTDMQLEAYWDEAFTTSLASGNLQFRPVRHSDGKLTVKFFSKRSNLGMFPSGGISMSVASELVPFIVQGLKQIHAQIQELERGKLGLKLLSSSV
jgi:hypothetical protein